MMIETAAYISLSILILAFVMTFIKLLVGPSLPDRVISLDLMFLLVIAFIINFIFISHEIAYLDMAPVIALIIFMGTVTIAIHLRKTKRKK